MNKSKLLSIVPFLCASFLVAGCPDDSTEPSSETNNNDSSTSDSDSSDPTTNSSVTLTTSTSADTTDSDPTTTTTMTTTMTTDDTSSSTDPTNATESSSSTDPTNATESSSSSAATESSSSTDPSATGTDTGMMGVWNCDDSYYGTDDGCDCGCGIPDPDCADGDIATCEFCSDEGSCNPWGCPGIIDPDDTALCAPVEGVPDEWTCNPTFYGDGDCNCGCGAVDSDCADATVDSCDFCNDQGSCNAGDCPGNIDAVDNSACVPNMGVPYGNCFADDVAIACSASEMFCLVDNNMAPTAGACTQSPCDTEADCPAAPDTGDAPVACIGLGMGGGEPNACLLDCSAGQTCPDGMECIGDFFCGWTS